MGDYWIDLESCKNARGKAMDDILSVWMMCVWNIREHEVSSLTNTFYISYSLDN